MATLKEFNKKLNGIAECIAKDQNKIEVAALTAAFVPMMKRIFGEGADGGGHTLDGQLMEGYSPAYQALRIRKNKGLNRAKNLVFDGSLRNSIQIGRSGNKNIIGFTDNDLAKIGRWQETSAIQINKPIFGLTEFEQQEGLNKLIEGIKETIAECLKRK